MKFLLMTYEHIHSHLLPKYISDVHNVNEGYFNFIFSSKFYGKFLLDTLMIVLVLIFFLRFKLLDLIP